MGIKFTNNATTILAAGIAAGDLSLTVATGTGSLFPSLSAGEWFYATLADTSGNIEIIKVTARTTDTFTIVRAQEGTAARAWLINDLVELRLTKDGIFDLVGTPFFFTATGTDTITGTVSAPLLAYEASQEFKFIAAGNNTGAVTLNLNGLGAVAVTKNGTQALTAGDIISGSVVTVTYDGTQFQLSSGVGAGAIVGVFYENSTNVSSDYTITTGKNAMSAGPITIDAGVTVTIPAGSVWTIV